MTKKEMEQEIASMKIKMENLELKIKLLEKEIEETPKHPYPNYPPITLPDSPNLKPPYYIGDVFPDPNQVGDIFPEPNKVTSQEKIWERYLSTTNP